MVVFCVMHLKRVANIQQEYIDIVLSYIRRIQSLFPVDDNPYYIIAQLIKNLCLLYFHNAIDSSILTWKEESDFIALLKNKKVFMEINIQKI